MVQPLDYQLFFISNNNHISGISYHMWKLKVGSEVNTSSNQNEETYNNHKQALFPHRSGTSA